MDPQNNNLGLKYSAIAVLFWGMLPIALKLSGHFIDAISLTWFRLAFALVVIYFIQRMQGQLGQFKLLNKNEWLRLGIAGLFLIGNYVTFVLSLKYLSPGEAQLNFQVAPFFLAFGGLLFFKERLSKVQLVCFFMLACGMLMFFHPHLNFASQQSSIWVGVITIQISAFFWAGYALLQKSLLAKLSSNNIMLCLFAIGAIALAPFTDFTPFIFMNGFEWAVILFCAINTLVAYGCFGQAIKYWPTASVSAMVGLTPVLSFTFTELVVKLKLWPDTFSTNNLDALSIDGIGLIVLAVISMQLVPLYLKRRKKLMMMAPK